MGEEAIAGPKTEPWKEHGWFLPYQLAGDEVFGVGRLTWWMNGIVRGVIPDGDIPPLHFHHGNDVEVRKGLPTIQGTTKRQKNPPLSPKGCRSHLEDLVDKMGSGWESMLYLVRWLYWGLGLPTEAESAPVAPYDAGWGDLLYKDFQLGRLQAADSDILGDMLADRHGSGWNPNAFYPTPMALCEMMARMTVADAPATDGKDSRLLSVCDPCVGTGRMLLAASGYSLNLYGMDIDRTMVDVCSINLALFAPWGVYLPRGIAEQMGRGRRGPERDAAAIQTMNDMRKEQGHPDAFPKGKEFAFNRHGQGNLFSTGGDE